MSKRHTFGGRALDRLLFEYEVTPTGGGAGEGGTGEPPAVPDFVAEKFRSAPDPVAAQAQSYAEAEKELARLRNEQAQEREQFAAALEQFQAAQQPPAPQYAPGQDPLLVAAQRAYDEGDVPTLLAITAQINQAATAQVIDQRLAALDERMGASTSADRELALSLAEQRVAPMWGSRWESEIVPKLQERLAENPGLLPASPSVEGYAEALTNLARQEDYVNLQTQLQQAEAERQAKLAAQTLAGGTARVTQQAPRNEDAWQEIKQADNGSWSKIVSG